MLGSVVFLLLLLSLLIIFQCNGDTGIQNPPHGLITCLDSITPSTSSHDLESISEHCSMLWNGPGSLLGFALDKLGTRLLYWTKVSMLMGKLKVYKEFTDFGTDNPIVLRARPRIGLRGFGIMMQECVDLFR